MNIISNNKSIILLLTLLLIIHTEFVYAETFKSINHINIVTNIELTTNIKKDFILCKFYYNETDFEICTNVKYKLNYLKTTFHTLGVLFSHTPLIFFPETYKIYDLKSSSCKILKHQISDKFSVQGMKLNLYINGKEQGVIQTNNNGIVKVPIKEKGVYEFVGSNNKYGCYVDESVFVN